MSLDEWNNETGYGLNRHDVGLRPFYELMLTLPMLATENGCIQLQNNDLQTVELLAELAGNALSAAQKGLGVIGSVLANIDPDLAPEEASEDWIKNCGWFVYQLAYLAVICRYYESKANNELCRRGECDG